VPRAKHLGRQPKLIAKRAGECLVRAVSRVKGNCQNIGRAAGERSGSLRQPTATDIAHNRPPGSDAEDTRHVVTGHTASVGNVIQSQLLRKVALDKPECLRYGVHTSSPISTTPRIPALPVSRLIGIAVLLRKSRITHTSVKRRASQRRLSYRHLG